MKYFRAESQKTIGTYLSKRPIVDNDDTFTFEEQKTEQGIYFVLMVSWLSKHLLNMAFGHHVFL